MAGYAGKIKEYLFKDIRRDSFDERVLFLIPEFFIFFSLKG